MYAKIDNVKAKPVAKQGRKATGLLQTAGLPTNRAMRLSAFEAHGIDIWVPDKPRLTTSHKAWSGDCMTLKRKSLTMRVFQCSENISENDDRIDDNMIKILGVLDGQKSLASIAFASGMSMTDFQKTIKALIELDLIVAIEAGETITE